MITRDRLTAEYSKLWMILYSFCRIAQVPVRKATRLANKYTGLKRPMPNDLQASLWAKDHQDELARIHDRYCKHKAELN